MIPRPVEDRLAKLRSFLPTLGVDAVFVSNLVNIRYLTGHSAEDAWLLVTSRKVFYITDFRYYELVSKALKGRAIEVVKFGDSLFGTVIELAVGGKAKVLGFEENHLTYYQFGRLKSFAGNKIKLKGLSGAIEALRAVKAQAELLAIREAIKVNLRGFAFIGKFIKPGISERDILYNFQDFIKQEQVEFAFPPIVASGPNSAYPHARVTERKLRASEPVLLDFGVEKNGYKSDLTRMFFLGKMPDSFKKSLLAIRGAQEAAFQKIRPGVPAKVVDATAREYLEKHGLARYFGHSLGHGVGLDTHEMPRLSTKSGDDLLENMVVTIEPGVYFPGRYGVRLEEMVLITKNGCEVLSGYRDNGSL
ncbi:MAG: aminopeptidase P family protein [Candidatus Omnitrophica bacterium]|nr:aminopeptidase P family protein [Candidatus Omnitrophota bacterium]